MGWSRILHSDEDLAKVNYLLRSKCKTWLNFFIFWICLSRLGKPFFRASNVIDIEGTGLGTSIVKEYVEVNKGVLIIESKLNEFTEFSLIFKK